MLGMAWWSLKSFALTFKPHHKWILCHFWEKWDQKRIPQFHFNCCVLPQEPFDNRIWLLLHLQQQGIDCNVIIWKMFNADWRVLVAASRSVNCGSLSCIDLDPNELGTNDCRKNWWRVYYGILYYNATLLTASYEDLGRVRVQLSAILIQTDYVVLYHMSTWQHSVQCSAVRVCSGPIITLNNWRHVKWTCRHVARKDFQFA